LAFLRLGKGEVRAYFRRRRRLGSSADASTERSVKNSMRKAHTFPEKVEAMTTVVIFRKK